MQKEEIIEKEKYNEFYRTLCETLEESEKDVNEGRVYDAREVFKELRRKYNY